MNGDRSIGGDDVVDALPMLVEDRLRECHDSGVDFRIDLVPELNCERGVAKRQNTEALFLWMMRASGMRSRRHWTYRRSVTEA